MAGNIFVCVQSGYFLCLENSSVLLGGGLGSRVISCKFDHFPLGWPSLRYFSSCPVVKTQSFIAGGAGSILSWETKIPYAAGCGQKLIKPEKNVFKVAISSHTSALPPCHSTPSILSSLLFLSRACNYLIRLFAHYLPILVSK